MNGFLGTLEAFFLGRREEPGVMPVRKKTEKEIAAFEARKESTILVIDDDRTILDVLMPLLKEEGYTVMTAQSGPKGLDLLRYAQKNIKVVLLDYSMPRFSGAETLEYVRKLVPGAKVVGLTGIDPQLLPEAYKTNVDRFVAKPFRSADLMKCVTELVEANTPAPAH